MFVEGGEAWRAQKSRRLARVFPSFLKALPNLGLEFSSIVLYYSLVRMAPFPVVPTI